ncbi:MAG TPA: hypothetical protein VGC54_06620 [Planctomycetota bacterium]
MALLAFGACQQDSARRDDFDRERDRILRAARRAELPPGNVRIRVERFETDSSDARTFELALRYRSGGLEIGAGGTTPGGLQVHVADGGLAAALSARSGSSRALVRSESFLMVVPGYAADLQLVGERPQPWIVVLPGIGTAAGVRTEVTGSGLGVFVHAASADTVDLELRPWFRRATGATVQADSMRTRLRVPTGAPVVVMADRSRRDTIARGLLSWRDEANEREVLLVLTAEFGG